MFTLHQFRERAVGQAISSEIPVKSPFLATSLVMSIPNIFEIGTNWR